MSLTEKERHDLAAKYSHEAGGYADPNERLHCVTLCILNDIAADIMERLDRVEGLLRDQKCHPSTSEPSSRQC